EAPRGPAADVDARRPRRLGGVPGARPARPADVRLLLGRHRPLTGHPRGPPRAFSRSRRARRPRVLESIRAQPAGDLRPGVPGGRVLERSSRADLVRFMSAAVEDDDPRDRWAEAFSMPYREFVDAFRGHLKSLGRRGTGATVDPKSVP